MTHAWQHGRACLWVKGHVLVTVRVGLLLPALWGPSGVRYGQGRYWRNTSRGRFAPVQGHWCYQVR